MAKYLLTFGTDRIAGSRGGATFQKAGVTYVIRKRSVPVQKHSELQSAKQNQFASVNHNWRKLNTTEKDSFADEAVNYPRVNSFGDQYLINGQQLQSSTNINLQENSLPQITTMPPAASLPVITDEILIADATLSELSIQFEPVIVPAGVSLQIFASRPHSPGRVINSVNDLQLLVTWPAGIVQGGNLFSIYESVIGPLSGATGQRLTAFGRYIQHSSGQVGPFSQISNPIV
jgi:hypothetical protein